MQEKGYNSTILGSKLENITDTGDKIENLPVYSDKLGNRWVVGGFSRNRKGETQSPADSKILYPHIELLRSDEKEFYTTLKYLYSGVFDYSDYDLFRGFYPLLGGFNCFDKADRNDFYQSAEKSLAEGSLVGVQNLLEFGVALPIFVYRRKYIEEFENIYSDISKKGKDTFYDEAKQFCEYDTSVFHARCFIAERRAKKTEKKSLLNNLVKDRFDGFCAPRIVVRRVNQVLDALFYDYAYSTFEDDPNGVYFIKVCTYGLEKTVEYASYRSYITSWQFARKMDQRSEEESNRKEWFDE